MKLLHLSVAYIIQSLLQTAQTRPDITLSPSCLIPNKISVTDAVTRFKVFTIQMEEEEEEEEDGKSAFLPYIFTIFSHLST
jgi:hypothetical protein